ncbi:MAG: hypothetical protein K2L54_05585, partial [Clostridiales bacterium]|nr:hypothetical protein [Clostridiales bacterium]
NIMYRRALYQAHVYGFLKSDGLSTFDLCAVLAAEKYIDKTAVKSKLKSVLSEQAERGEYRGDFRDALYIAYAVTDYVTFAADYGFLDELVEYAPRRAHGRKITLKTTVAEHCMRAVDGNIFQNVFNYDKTVRGIYDCKILAELLRCFADIPNASAERKERYIAMLGKVAATYSEETERLKNRSLYALNSLRATFTCARLLFESGEYDKSYNLLKYNNPLYARKSSDPNIIQKSFFTENDSSTCGATAAAMFYTTVTECLVGLKLHGDKISIMPMIGGETPHLRVELDTGDGRAKIDVDNSIKRGEWRIKLDRISYSAANVELRGRGDAEILLYRSGDGTID